MPLIERSISRFLKDGDCASCVTVLLAKSGVFRHTNPLCYLTMLALKNRNIASWMYPDLGTWWNSDQLTKHET